MLTTVTAAVVTSIEPTVSPNPSSEMLNHADGTFSSTHLNIIFAVDFSPGITCSAPLFVCRAIYNSPHTAASTHRPAVSHAMPIVSDIASPDGLHATVSIVQKVNIACMTVEHMTMKINVAGKPASAMASPKPIACPRQLSAKILAVRSLISPSALPAVSPSSIGSAASVSATASATITCVCGIVHPTTGITYFPKYFCLTR
mmetsp:Transcript_116873/g.365338  ORF Transcript_116873/g.365338 Transcript_116873/m.365338 type:complete len:202 (+) Transcript_116873:190-795(+)